MIYHYGDCNPLVQTTPTNKTGLNHHLYHQAWHLSSQTLQAQAKTHLPHGVARHQKD